MGGGLEEDVAPGGESVVAGGRSEAEGEAAAMII